MKVCWSVTEGTVGRPPRKCVDIRGVMKGEPTERWRNNPHGRCADAITLVFTAAPRRDGGTTPTEGVLAPSKSSTTKRWRDDPHGQYVCGLTAVGRRNNPGGKCVDPRVRQLFKQEEAAKGTAHVNFPTLWDRKTPQAEGVLAWQHSGLVGSTEPLCRVWSGNGEPQRRAPVKRCGDRTTFWDP